MDYSIEIENLKNELKTLGFDDEKINQLLDLAAEELIEEALDYLAENTDEQTLDTLAQEMEKPVSTTEDAQTRLNMVLEKAYGMQAEEKKGEFLYNYLKTTLEDTKKAKDLYDRYQSGDPSAVAAIKAQEGDPDAQEIIDRM
ncbi:MAG TPA: hypothetical protein PKH06_00095 [Candidatus Dojkabacteria bacterium]|nr:hypothetical protein [Candidatus Dojkabacteria bacterium]